jgi:tRNA nucleotidyltransferase/poly(A) polymerase
MILRDNVYGTIAEDALRRDFTINALYYNIDDFSLVDYAGGLDDIREGRLRLIGTTSRPAIARTRCGCCGPCAFACKLGFIIDPACEAPLPAMAPLLAEVPPARLFEEMLKLFHTGYALNAFEKLRHYDLFAQLFPETDEAWRARITTSPSPSSAAASTTPTSASSRQVGRAAVPVRGADVGAGAAALQALLDQGVAGPRPWPGLA